MSWERSAKNKVTGLFTVTVWDYDGNEFFKGEYADWQEANEVGQQQERLMMAKMQNKADGLEEMSIDDILAELEI